MLGRLKFELDDLVAEMLSYIPEEMFSRSDTTFLDPAMGGGQFVSKIEQKLRENGHSNANISERVFGYETNKMRVNFAVNKHELVGNYQRGGLEDMMEKKFDVVIGNPPYQDGNQGLWQDFSKKSIQLVKDNGILAFITPNSWANGSNLGTDKNLFNSLFQKYDCNVIHTNVNRFFKNIGKNIGYWIITKKSYSGKTRIYDENNESKDINILKYPFFINVFSFTSLEIFQKILSYENFYSDFVEKATDKKRYYAFPKIRHNAGYRKGYRYDEIEYEFPTSPVVVGIDCQDKTFDQVLSIHSQFESSVFKFLWKIYGANDAGSFGWILRNMPKLPDDKIYTDEDVYIELGLEGFSEYIEKNVK